MQQGVSDTPLLPVGVEGHGFVIEADDLAATLLVVMVKETDGVADGHFVAAQPSLRIVPDADIDAIQIDSGIGNQPVLSSVGLTDQHFLGPELAYLRRTKLVGPGIEIFDWLADA